MSGVRDQRAKRQPAGRWYQCPGCWSGSFNRMTSDGYECECGERLFIIDLRDTEPSPFRPTTPAASDGSLDVEAKPLIRAAISDGYYEARNDGQTMEYAADDATRRVFEVLEGFGIRVAARLSESPSEGKTE